MPTLEKSACFKMVNAYLSIIAKMKKRVAPALKRRRVEMKKGSTKEQFGLVIWQARSMGCSVYNSGFLYNDKAIRCVDIEGSPTVNFMIIANMAGVKRLLVLTSSV